MALPKRLWANAVLLLLLQHGYAYSLRDFLASKKTELAREEPVLVPEATPPPYDSELYVKEEQVMKAQDKILVPEKNELARRELVPEATPPPYDSEPDVKEEQTISFPFQTDSFDEDDEYVTSDGKTFTLVKSSPWKGFRRALSKMKSSPNLRQGDIMEESKEQRKASDGTGCARRWPTDSAIPYMYEADIAADVRANVDLSFETWQNLTCLTFTEVSTTPATNHFVVTQAEPGCWAHLGMLCGSGVNKINLGSGCNDVGVILHEIGHGLGLYHEQSRSDRDSYVRINEANVEADKLSNFDKADTKNFDLLYDYNSIMHYGRTFFSKDSETKTTIETLDPLQQFRIGSASELSHYDINIVNQMYTCSSSCVSPPSCTNGGYVDKNCDCKCPPNYSGADCATKDSPDFEPMDANCGTQTVTTDGTIKSHNYPGVHPVIRCMWYLKPPTGKKVQIKFDTVNLYNSKFIDHVLVLTDGYSGEKKYTGTELDKKTFTSKSDFGMVIFHRTGCDGCDTGFTATVKMVDGSGPPPSPPPAPKPKPKPKPKKKKKGPKKLHNKKKGKKSKKPGKKSPSKKKTSSKKKKASKKKPTKKKKAPKKKKKKGLF